MPVADVSLPELQEQDAPVAEVSAEPVENAETADAQEEAPVAEEPAAEENTENQEMAGCPNPDWSWIRRWPEPRIQIGIEDVMTVVAAADEADEVVTVPQVAAAEADGQRRRMRRMAERLWNKIEELEERVAVAEGVAAEATRAAVEAKVLAEAAAAEAAAAAVAADGWRARSREELGRRVVAEAEVAVWRNWRQVVDLDTEAARWRGWRP